MDSIHASSEMWKNWPKGTNDLKWLPKDAEEPVFWSRENMPLPLPEAETEEQAKDLDEKIYVLNYPWREWKKSMHYHNIIDPRDKAFMDLELHEEIVRNNNYWVLPDPTMRLHWTKIRDYVPWWVIKDREEKNQAQAMQKKVDLYSTTEESRLAHNRFLNKIEKVNKSISKSLWFENGFIYASVSYDVFKQMKVMCDKGSIKFPFQWIGEKSCLKAAANTFELANSLLCTASPYALIEQSHLLPLQRVCEMIQHTTKSDEDNVWFVEKFRSGKRNDEFRFNEERMAYIVEHDRLFEAWMCL